MDENTEQVRKTIEEATYAVDALVLAEQRLEEANRKVTGCMNDRNRAKATAEAAKKKLDELFAKAGVKP